MSRASYYIYWSLGIAWMVISCVQQIFGNMVYGLIDMVIGVLFMILAEMQRGRR